MSLRVRVLQVFLFLCLFAIQTFKRQEASFFLPRIALFHSFFSRLHSRIIIYPQHQSLHPGDMGEDQDSASEAAPTQAPPPKKKKNSWGAKIRGWLILAFLLAFAALSGKWVMIYRSPSRSRRGSFCANQRIDRGKLHLYDAINYDPFFDRHCPTETYYERCRVDASSCKCWWFSVLGISLGRCAGPITKLWERSRHKPCYVIIFKIGDCRVFRPWRSGMGIYNDWWQCKFCGFDSWPYLWNQNRFVGFTYNN